MSVPTKKYDKSEYKKNSYKLYFLDTIEDIVLGSAFIKGLIREDCKNGICKLIFDEIDDFSKKNLYIVLL